MKLVGIDCVSEAWYMWGLSRLKTMLTVDSANHYLRAELGELVWGVNTQLNGSFVLGYWPQLAGRCRGRVTPWLVRGMIYGLAVWVFHRRKAWVSRALYRRESGQTGGRPSE